MKERFKLIPIFKTCVRARPFELQKLGADFYDREASKPLFNKRNFLTVHSLYKYHCLLEMFKMIKQHSPIPLYSLFKKSPRRVGYLISPPLSTLFAFQASSLWNQCLKQSSKIDFTTSIAVVKSRLKCY